MHESIAVTTSFHWDALTTSGQNRRITLALCVALLLHTPLLIPPGTWLFGTSDQSSAPDSELRIELVQGQSEQDTTAPEPQPEQKEVEERVAAATPDEATPNELREQAEVPVDGAGENVAEAEQQLEAPAGTVADEALSTPSEMLADAGTDVSAESIDELQPAQASPPAAEPEPITEPTPLAEHVVATVAAAQELVLTRKLEREALELLESKDLERHLSFESNGREYSAVLTRQPAVDGTDIERLTIDLTTEQNGERLQTSLQMKRLAFSHFTQLIDNWDRRVQLHDDVIAGRFHSNSAINIGYSREAAPRMLGKVTSTHGVRMLGDERWRPTSRRMFVGGRPQRTRAVELPQVDLAARARTSRDSDVHVLRDDTLLVFIADGRFDTIEVASGNETRHRLASGKPTYIIGAADAEVRVRGVVNGNVTVYSPTRILIQGDLTYVHGASSGADADSYLGLVSDGTVEVDRSKVTGPGDLDIHAGIYARRRFIVNDTGARRAGTLLIHGSLTAGSLTETEPRYATRIEFDPRFERQRPPGFPATDRYELESWDRNWRVAEGPERAE